MRKAKIKFLMRSRREFMFNVEGENQGDWYTDGVDQLSAALLLEQKEMGEELITSRDREISSFQTFPEEEDNKPEMIDQDSAAIRSALQKIRFELLPIAPMVEVAKVFTFGAYTYGDRNWEEGFSWSRCVGAIWRHFLKWSMGEQNDDESGHHHLAHVVANCLFLMQYTITKKGTDNREQATPEFIKQLFESIDYTQKTKEN